MKPYFKGLKKDLQSGAQEVVLRSGRHSKWMFFVSAKDMAYSLWTLEENNRPKRSMNLKILNQNVKQAELM
jgi:hypothetical protein